MATSKDYMEFVIDKSGLGDDIATRNMMGEYLLYYKGKHIGDIYDNRLLALLFMLYISCCRAWRNVAACMPSIWT